MDGSDRTYERNNHSRRNYNTIRQQHPRGYRGRDWYDSNYASPYRRYSPFHRPPFNKYDSETRNQNKRWRKPKKSKLSPEIQPPSPVEGTEEYTLQKIEETSALIMRQLLTPHENVLVVSKPESPPCVAEKTAESKKRPRPKEKPSDVPHTSPKVSRKGDKRYGVDDVQAKIMNHISNLNRGRKRNFINADKFGYDAVIQDINKQKRLEISRALRCICSESSEYKESSSALINAIIPDMGIKIEDMPKEFVEKLSETIDCELSFFDNEIHSFERPLDGQFPPQWNVDCGSFGQQYVMPELFNKPYLAEYNHYVHPIHIPDITECQPSQKSIMPSTEVFFNIRESPGHQNVNHNFFNNHFDTETRRYPPHTTSESEDAVKAVINRLPSRSDEIHAVQETMIPTIVNTDSSNDTGICSDTISTVIKTKPLEETITIILVDDDSNDSANQHGSCSDEVPNVIKTELLEKSGTSPDELSIVIKDESLEETIISTNMYNDSITQPETYSNELSVDIKDEPLKESIILMNNGSVNQSRTHSDEVPVIIKDESLEETMIPKNMYNDSINELSVDIKDEPLKESIILMNNGSVNQSGTHSDEVSVIIKDESLKETMISTNMYNGSISELSLDIKDEPLKESILHMNNGSVNQSGTCSDEVSVIIKDESLEKTISKNMYNDSINELSVDIKDEPLKESIILRNNGSVNQTERLSDEVSVFVKEEPLEETTIPKNMDNDFINQSGTCSDELSVVIKDEASKETITLINDNNDSDNQHVSSSDEAPETIKIELLEETIIPINTDNDSVNQHIISSDEAPEVIETESLEETIVPINVYYDPVHKSVTYPDESNAVIKGEPTEETTIPINMDVDSVNQRGTCSDEAPEVIKTESLEETIIPKHVDSDSVTQSETNPDERSEVIKDEPSDETIIPINMNNDSVNQRGTGSDEVIETDSLEETIIPLNVNNDSVNISETNPDEPRDEPLEETILPINIDIDSANQHGTCSANQSVEEPIIPINVDNNSINTPETNPDERSEETTLPVNMDIDSVDQHGTCSDELSVVIKNESEETIRPINVDNESINQNGTCSNEVSVVIRNDALNQSSPSQQGSYFDETSEIYDNTVENADANRFKNNLHLPRKSGVLDVDRTTHADIEEQNVCTDNVNSSITVKPTSDISLSDNQNGIVSENSFDKWFGKPPESLNGAFNKMVHDSGVSGDDCTTHANIEENVCSDNVNSSIVDKPTSDTSLIDNQKGIINENSIENWFGKPPETLNEAFNKMIQVDELISRLTHYRQNLFTKFLKKDTTSLNNDNEKTNRVVTIPILELPDISEKIFVLKVLKNQLLVGTESGKIYIYNMNPFVCDKVLDVTNVPITSLLFNKETSGAAHLYVGCFENALRIYDCEKYRLLKRIRLEDCIMCMENRWGYIFIGTKRGHLLSYSIQKQVIEFEDQLYCNVIQVIIATTEGARRVLIVGSSDSTLCIKDAMNGLYLRKFSPPAENFVVRCAILGNRYMYCGTAVDIFVFGFHDGKIKHIFRTGHTNGVNIMKLLGNLLFAGCGNGNIYVYNFTENVYLDVMRGPGGSIISMEVLDNQVIVGTRSMMFKSLPIPDRLLTYR